MTTLDRTVTPTTRFDPHVEAPRPAGSHIPGARFQLAGYTFLILFFELALIRYTAGYVRVFGFYMNFVLIAAFLGMGVGMIRATTVARLRWLAPAALLLLLGAVKLFSTFAIQPGGKGTEAIWLVAASVPGAPSVGVLPVVTLLFALCALFFVPLGALAGQAFRSLPALVPSAVRRVGRVGTSTSGSSMPNRPACLAQRWVRITSRKVRVTKMALKSDTATPMASTRAKPMMMVAPNCWPKK